MSQSAPSQPRDSAIAARLRALLARRMVVLGRRRGNPLAALAGTIGRAAKTRTRRLSARRADRALGTSELTCPGRLALLGLGIAGGGGGSPGALAPQPT